MATVADIALVNPCFAMTQFTLSGADQAFTFQPFTRKATIIADAATTASLFLVPLATGSAGHAGLPLPVIGQLPLVMDNPNLSGVAIVLNGTAAKNVYILEEFSHR